MKSEKTYLEPINDINRQKSFYKKAYTTKEGIYTCLYSYDTLVMVKTKSGYFYRVWGGYSKTTLEHIKAFMNYNISKKEWLEMGCINPKTFELVEKERYKITFYNPFTEYTPALIFDDYESALEYAEDLICKWDYRFVYQITEC